MEKKLQKQIIKWCHDNHILAVKVDSTSTRGFPDLVTIDPHGQVIFVELKTPTGRLSDTQRFFQEKLIRQNANVRTIRTIEDFQNLFNV